MRQMTKVITLFTLVLLIGAAAFAQPTGVLFVKNNRVGIGEPNPGVDFDVKNTLTTRNTMLRIASQGPPQFSFTDGTVTWLFALRGAGFEANRAGSGGTEFLVSGNGTGTFRGAVNATAFNVTSSRALKSEFEPVDSAEILAKVRQLPISEWRFTADGNGSRHLGPMAEDFSETFGLGHDDTRISVSDEAGIALAAIQGLAEENEGLRSEVRELRALIQQLQNQLGSPR